MGQEQAEFADTVFDHSDPDQTATIHESLRSLSSLAPIYFALITNLAHRNFLADFFAFSAFFCGDSSYPKKSIHLNS
jgi:hypothetical protein